MDLDGYGEALERTARAMSVSVETLAVKPSADGRLATVGARLALDDGAFVEVHETVEVGERVVQPRKFSYYYVEGGIERFGYDRDPTHEPVLHVHRGAGHASEPASGMTLRKVIEEAWETRSLAVEEQAAVALATKPSRD